MYKVYVETYFDQCMALSDSKERKLGNKYYPINLFLQTFNYDDWFENKKSTDETRKSDKKESTVTIRKSGKKESVDLSDMPPLEGDQEVKEGKVLKILTPKLLLNRLTILLAQIKAGNNSYKLNSEIRKVLYL